MIYNRYIPGSNGVYTRQRIDIPEKKETVHIHAPVPADHSTEKKCTRHTPAPAIDLGDVLLLCIAILLILESDSDDTLSVLVAIAAFVFMQ